VIRELIFTLFWAASLTLTLLFVAARMLCLGLSVEPAQLTALHRQPGFLARALVANFIIVPALGVTIAAMVWVPPQAALAILLLGLLGGGVDFLAVGEKADRDVRLRAALTFVLSLIGGLLSPLIRLLIQPIGTPLMGSIWALVGVSALIVPVPLLIGLLVRRTAPAAARVISKAMAVVAVVLFVAAAATTFLVKARLASDLGVRSIAAMLLLIVGAGIAGWVLGGPSAGHRALLARTTIMRNAGLSLFLAIVTFPNAAVDLIIVLFVVLELATRLLRVLIDWTVIPSMAMLRSRKS
jgi:BASS family bile acid:Na+ symporter